MTLAVQVCLASYLEGAVDAFVSFVTDGRVIHKCSQVLGIDQEHCSTWNKSDVGFAS